MAGMEIIMKKKMTKLFGTREKTGGRVAAFALTLAVLAGILSGCAGGGDDADTALAELNTKQYIKIGDYSAFTVSVSPKQEITDEDVDLYIRYMLSHYPITDDTEYKVQSGDTVNIDFTGRKDGVAFDGGTGEGYNLTIGSGAFVPGFEDGLIGAGIGETRDIELTFPENYQPELAGADVVFTVTVNYIYTTTLTDGLAAKIYPDAPTVAQYRAYAKELLLQEAQRAYDNAVYNEITNTLMADSKVKKDAPDNLVDRYFQQQVDYVTQLALFNYNTSYENLIQTTGNTVEEYEAGMREDALNYANNMVLYQAIANAENLAVTEEEIQAEAAQNAASGAYESADAFLESVGRDTVTDHLMRTKVLQFLRERTTITEVEGAAPENLQGAMDLLNEAAGE